MKGYIKFTKGDFWVYQLEQDTSIKDTLTCTNFLIQNNDCGSKYISTSATSCSKVYTLKLQHSNVNYFPRFLEGEQKPGNEVFTVEKYSNYENVRLERELPFTWYNVGYEPIFVMHYDDKNNLQKDQNPYKANLIDTILIGQKTYKKPVFVKLDSLALNTENWFDSLYFHSSTGLIKYNNLPNQTWQLVKSHIQ